MLIREKIKTQIRFLSAIIHEKWKIIIKFLKRSINYSKYINKHQQTKSQNNFAGPLFVTFRFSKRVRETESD